MYAGVIFEGFKLASRIVQLIPTFTDEMYDILKFCNYTPRREQTPNNGTNLA